MQNSSAGGSFRKLSYVISKSLFIAESQYSTSCSAKSRTGQCRVRVSALGDRELSRLHQFYLPNSRRGELPVASSGAAFSGVAGGACHLEGGTTTVLCAVMSM